MMGWISDFADQAVILPTAVTVFLVIATAGAARRALLWAAMMAATLGCVMVAKMYVAACGGPVDAWWGLHSPSGHTASAAAFCGGLAALAVPRRRAAIAASLAAAGAAILIGASRLALDVHTPADVLAGAVIGIGGACVLACLDRGPPHTAVSRKVALRALLAAAFIATLMHGHRLHAEEQIGHMAVTIWPFRECQR